MRINERWHQILGTHEGRALSGAADCNAFAVETSQGLVLFDSGAGIDDRGLPAAFAAAGLAEGPAHLVLTHGHADHSGGAATLAERYRLTLHAGSLTAQWLADGDEGRISLAAARRAGVYPVGYRWRPIRPDHIVVDGVPITVGDVEITPLATPGHSADHFSYLVRADGRSLLIAGDAIFAEGTILLQDTWDSSVADSCASIRRLATQPIDGFLSGHGPAVVTDPGSHIAKAMRRVERLLPPANFI